MYRRPGRKLSQHSHMLLQQIRNENDRLKQIDKGLRYAPPAIVDGRPLHVGPQIDLRPVSATHAA